MQAQLERENRDLKERLSTLQQELSHAQEQALNSPVEAGNPHQDELNQLWLQSSGAISAIQQDLARSTATLTSSRNEFEHSQNIYLFGEVCFIY